MWSWAYFLSFLLLASPALAGEPSLKVHDSSFVPDAVLRVTFDAIGLGCIDRPSVRVNGTIPGPELRFKTGKVIWIRVYNDMTDHNTTIHWHGLTQAAAPFSDGSPQASQWPIPPGRFFDYELSLKGVEPGTYFYHSHVGFQAVTCTAPLIVEEASGSAPYAYDDERIITLTDIWNITDDSIEHGLVSDPFTWSGETGAVLVNGLGISDYPPTRNDSSCSLARISVQPETTYRLRFIGATALSFLALAIEDHRNLTIIEADAAYTQPYDTDFLQIGSGQRYSTLLTTLSCAELSDQTDGRAQFYIQIETRDRPANLTGYAILDYGNACGDSGSNSRYGRHHRGARNAPSGQAKATPPTGKVNPSPPPLQLPPTEQGWLDYDLHPLTPGDFPSASEVTRRVTIDIYQLTANGTTRWQQNGLSWTENSAPVPYLVALYEDATQHLPSYSVAVSSGTGYDARVAAWPARIGEVLELVIQNTGSSGGGVDTHPMHSHGQHYWYLGSGRGAYDAGANEARLAAAAGQPVRRDTTMLYRYSDAETPGRVHSWVAWRLRVTQPGVWMIHCHILQHILMGMSMPWVFGDTEDILRIPLPMVEGYLRYGGNVYGDVDSDPTVVHFFDSDSDE